MISGMALDIGLVSEKLGDLVSVLVVDLRALGRYAGVVEGDAWIVRVMLLLEQEPLAAFDKG